MGGSSVTSFTMVEAVEVATPRTRDSELWFDDGTIVLVAQSVEFCVYRGQLARRFDVFKEFNTFPQSTVDFEHGSSTSAHHDVPNNKDHETQEIWGKFVNGIVGQAESSGRVLTYDKTEAAGVLLDRAA